MFDAVTVRDASRRGGNDVRKRAIRTRTFKSREKSVETEHERQTESSLVRRVTHVVPSVVSVLERRSRGVRKKAWVPLARPHFEGSPPSLIFDHPLLVTAE
jgi:hypothetical protein